MTDKGDDAFAVVGYGYRLPGGIRSDGDFWKMLKERGFIQEPVFERYGRGARPLGLTGRGHCSRLGSDFEGLIQNGEDLLFDCKHFGISLNEAKFMDPQLKLLLACAWETIESAGQDMRRLRNGPTGVFIGAQASSANTWRTNLDVNEFSISGRSHAMLPNRISYQFNLMGPSLSVGTACSSGITALHTALAAIRQGDCRQALVGSVCYIGDLRMSLGFNALGVISPEGKCHSFDAGANGYMRSEGAVLVAVKPLADAERDGDHIHAVIEATALNAAGSADDAGGLDPGRYITAPTRHSQVELMRTACARAGLSPSDFDYVEAHATGTQVGDPIEGNAIGEALGGPDRKTPLRVAGVKSNLGHSESSAFFFSLIKVILMIRERTFAPMSSHFAIPNPDIDFAGHNMQVQTVCEPFPERPVVIGINSFGFGGANGHCVVREYRPEKPRPYSMPLVPGAGFMIPLSARTSDALAQSAKLLHGVLTEGDEVGVDPNDLYTLAANLSCRRTHFGVRTAFAVDNSRQLIDALKAFAEKPESKTALTREGGPALAMVFSGQGTQWAGCAGPLYDTSPVFRRTVDAIESHWAEYADFSLREACLSAGQEELDECKLAQPVIFMVQCALLELLKTWGVYPDCVVGHSAGEVAAAYACDALSLEDATRLIYHRSRLQQLTAGSGRMLAIGLDLAGVEEVLDALKIPFRPGGGEPPRVSIACENAPASTVICGAEGELKPVIAELENRRLQHGLLPGNIAFHSPAMDPIKDQVLESLSFLDECPLGKTEVPFVSSVSTQLVENLGGRYWWDNIRQPVRFAETMENVQKHYRPDIILEIAPHCALQPTILQCFERISQRPTVMATLMRDTDSRTSFHRSLGELFCSGLELDFASAYPRPKPITHLLPGHPTDPKPTMEFKVDDEIFLKRSRFSIGPLVGRKAEWGKMAFESRISAKSFPHLMDHYVNQMPIMPASGFMETILEAFSGEAIHFEEMEFLRPCPIPTKDPMQFLTKFQPTGDGQEQYGFTIESRPFDGEEGGDLHCRGLVRRIDKNAPLEGVARHLDEIDRSRFLPIGLEESEELYGRISVLCGDNFNFGPHVSDDTKCQGGFDDP